MKQNLITNSAKIHAVVIGIFAMSVYMPVSAEWVDVVADGKLEYHHDSNINQSAFAEDELDDNVTSAQLSAGRYYQFNPDGANYTRLRLATDLELRAHDQFDGLDRNNIGVSASLAHKTGLGPDEPWIRAHLSALHENVDDNDRDKEIYNLGFQTGKQFTDRFSASVDASYNVHNGKDDLETISTAVGGPDVGSDVYDLKRYILSVDARYQLYERFLLSGFYSYLNGELNGECTVPNVGVVVTTIEVTAVTPDKVFGGCRYRFDGSANTLGLAGTYAINAHASISFGFKVSEAGSGDLDYDDEQYFANFRYSY